MKFKNALNLIGRGNILVVDLEDEDIKVGDRLVFGVRGIEGMSGMFGLKKDNIGLVLKRIFEENNK